MSDVDERSVAAMAAEAERMRVRVEDEAGRQLSEGYRSPVARYQNDVQFHTAVDMCRAFIRGAQFTPTELREAVILAAIMEEDRRAAAVAMPGPWGKDGG